MTKQRRKNTEEEKKLHEEYQSHTAARELHFNLNDARGKKNIRYTQYG